MVTKWSPSGILVSDGLGIRWNSMVFNGIQWFSMVFNGIQWYSMVSDGLEWSRIVLDGVSWSQIVIDGLDQLIITIECFTPPPPPLEWKIPKTFRFFFPE